MSVFDDMAVFTRVVEQGSFSGAGRTLRMSPALVSSRIARLESHLGVRLFNRTTRRVTVTEAGRRYYDDCLDIRRRVADAEARVSEHDTMPSGILRLTSSTSFGRQFLANQIPTFANRFPDVSLQYRMTDALVDVFGDGMDISVRIGPLADSSLKARILSPCPRYIFAAPDYLAKQGIPETPRDLIDHNCLLLRFPGSRQFRWRFQEASGEDYDVGVEGTLDSNNGEALLEWALMGAGLVFKTYFEVADHVKAGRLKIVLADHMPQDAYIAALYPYEKYIPPRVRAFIDFLDNAMKADGRFGAKPPEDAFIC
ncbi:MAG: LysR family transcriptional regulator [Alphaproteobacteria bacterium]|nr:LysR family transcriptional regulator [Alphaproteobacteria bacterium]